MCRRSANAQNKPKDLCVENGCMNPRKVSVFGTKLHYCESCSNARIQRLMKKLRDPKCLELVKS